MFRSFEFKKKCWYEDIDGERMIDYSNKKLFSSINLLPCFISSKFHSVITQPFCLFYIVFRQHLKFERISILKEPRQKHQIRWSYQVTILFIRKESPKRLDCWYAMLYIEKSPSKKNCVFLNKEKRCKGKKDANKKFASM